LQRDIDLFAGKRGVICVPREDYRVFSYVAVQIRIYKMKSADSFFKATVQFLNGYRAGGFFLDVEDVQ
jgi:hypothetical protein